VNGAQTVGFAYDAGGLVTQAGALAVSRAEASGQVDSTQLGDVRSRQDYDGYGDLANLRYADAAGTLFQQSIVRDALGRITSLREVASARIRCTATATTRPGGSMR